MEIFVDFVHRAPAVVTELSVPVRDFLLSKYPFTKEITTCKLKVRFQIWITILMISLVIIHSCECVQWSAGIKSRD